MEKINKKEYFLDIFKRLEKKYGKTDKRLAGEGWKEAWQTLIATVLSAQTRDEVTIVIAEDLFERYPTLKSLSKAKYKDVFKTLKSINYNKTKTKNIINASKFIINNFNGKIPGNIEELTRIPGVGRKTANLIIAEVHGKDAICIDTHCHRLLNVLDFVHTKNPKQTEMEMMKIAPKRYWSKINRLFVLFGKDVRGRDKKKILTKLND